MLSRYMLYKDEATFCSHSEDINYSNINRAVVFPKTLVDVFSKTLFEV